MKWSYSLLFSFSYAMRTPFLKLSFKALNFGQIIQIIYQNEEEGLKLMIDHSITLFYYIKIKVIVG